MSDHSPDSTPFEATSVPSSPKKLNMLSLEALVRQFAATESNRALQARLDLLEATTTRPSVLGSRESPPDSTYKLI